MGVAEAILFGNHGTIFGMNALLYISCTWCKTLWINMCKVSLLQRVRIVFGAEFDT